MCTFRGITTKRNAENSCKLYIYIARCAENVMAVEKETDFVHREAFIHLVLSPHKRMLKTHVNSTNNPVFFYSASGVFPRILFAETGF
jgi:hypothetical protein